MANKKVILASVGIFILFLFMLWGLKMYMGEGAKCLANPFTYGAQKAVGTLPDTKLMCQCSIYSPTTQYNPFWFDNQSINQGSYLGN